MPYYLESDKRQASQEQIQGWTELARYVRTIDPEGHPLTIHPTRSGHEQVEDPALLDLDMLQTGHGARTSLPNALKLLDTARSLPTTMPALVAEACYEGIFASNGADVQRQLFWASVLSGAAGHTYGANGLWQVNRREQAFGPSPHGSSWGSTPWDEAYLLPGSEQVGFGRSILGRYRWWAFEPHPEWAKRPEEVAPEMQPYAAGIPGQVRVYYLPEPRPPRVQHLDGCYTAQYVDPKDGQSYPLGRAVPDDEGCWQAPRLPILQDWLLVLEREQEAD